MKDFLKSSIFNLQEPLQSKAGRVPVTSLLSGEILEWKKGNGDLVWRGETLCIIKPDVAPYKRFEIPSPAKGRLTIKVEKGWVLGGVTVIAEIEEILATIIV